ncbi:MAG: hypothetical protein QNI84_15065 [Henriciella sp.]|nr:hypothetical protein [Henriciella sp.]
MTDNPATPSIEDSAPIDAEFEPAPKQAREGGGAKRIIFAGIAFIALVSLGAIAVASGLVPGLGGSADEQSALETQISELRDQVEQNETAYATLRSSLAEQETASTNTKNAIATLVTRLDSIERSLSDLSRDTSELRETLSAIQVVSSSDGTDPETGAPISVPVNPLILDRLENLENALTGFSDTPQPGAAEISTLAADIDTLRNSLRALDEKIEADLNPAAVPGADSTAAEAALALSAIEAAARRGRPFLVSHQKLALSLPNDPNVASLARFASTETPTLTELQSTFAQLEDRALDVDAKAQGGSTSWLRSMLGNAVTVRRDGEVSTADQIDMARTALTDRDLPAAIEAIEPLSPDVQAVFTEWLQSANQRLELEQALEGLRLTMIAKDRE